MTYRFQETNSLISLSFSWYWRADCEKQINGYDGSFFAKFSLQKWKTKEAMQKAAFKFQNKASIKPTGTTYYAVARGNATGIFFTQYIQLKKT